MATVQDFIKTFMDVNQLLLQKQELALAEENARIARLAAVQGVSQQLFDRGAIPGLSNLFGDSAGGDVTEILMGSAPGAGVTQRGLEAEGLSAATPDERSRLAAESLTRGATGVGRYQLGTEDFLSELLGRRDLTPEMQRQMQMGYQSRLATGMAPGELAVSSAVAGLGPTELTEGAGVGLGTRVSAGDALSATVSGAGTRAQETGQQLNFVLGQDRLNWEKQLVANGLTTGGNVPGGQKDWQDPKWVVEQIEAIAGKLAENPNLPPALADLYQRQILSLVMVNKGTTLDPFLDIAKPKQEGETEEMYRERVSAEMANLMESITGRQMNPRTFLGEVMTRLPGGGR